MSHPSQLLSRRHLLQGALCAGLAWPAARTGAGGAPLPLITKAVPSTGERLPAVGLGTDAFQNAQRDIVNREIRRLVQLEGAVIDTAGSYGDSEALIGAALAATGNRERVFLATKLTGGRGHLFDDDEQGIASFERSFKRLRTDRIDLLQVHNLDGVDDIMPMLQGWKKSGRIRYLGITTSRESQHADMLRFMQRYVLDFIQIDYSIDSRDAANQVLPLALERKVAVLVNRPLAHATLIGEAGQRPLPPWAADIDVSSWGQFFLKYVISHPAVTCALSGTTNLAHLEDNQSGARGRLPDAAMRARMEQYWDAKS